MRTLLPSVLIHLLFFLSVSGDIYSNIIELEGSAKFISSTDNRMTSYSTDESKWESVIIPSDLSAKPYIKGNTFYYRIRLSKKAAQIKSANMGIMFTGIGGTAELFLNGLPVKEKLEKSYGVYVYAIPRSAIFKNKDNILTLKIVRKSYHSKLGIYSTVYFGNLYEILDKCESWNLLYISIAIFVLVCSLLGFFTQRRSSRKYYPLFLAFALLFSAVYIFLFSSFANSVILNFSCKLRIFAFLEILIISFYVFFLRFFYGEGYKLIEIPYFVLNILCSLYVFLIKDVYTIRYIELVVFGISLVPFAYYVPIIWKDIFKKRFYSLFFLLGASLAFIFAAFLFFLNLNNPYINIVPATICALFFSFAVLMHYVLTYHDLLESKYILESKALLNSVVVEEKNAGYFEVDNKLHALEEMLSNMRKMCAEVQNKLTDQDRLELKGLGYKVNVHSSKLVSGDKLVIEKLGDDALRFIVFDYPGDEITSALCNLLFDKEIGKTAKIKSTSRVLDKLNKAFLSYNISTFFSLAVVDVYPGRKIIKYSSAGFPDILIINGGKCTSLKTGGGPIGLDDTPYEETEFALDAHGEIVIYTDGVMHQLRKEKNMPFKDYIATISGDNIYNSLLGFFEKNQKEILDDMLILKIDIT